MFEQNGKICHKMCKFDHNFVKKCHINLTFRHFMDYTAHKHKGDTMLTVFDSEALIKIYRYLNKKCDAIDKFIKNHAYYFGYSSEEFASVDVFNNIIELMARKNQLINLKLIVDSAIKSLDEIDKKVLFVKMRYSLSMEEFCGVLGLKQRTAFRRIERAFFDLTEALNKSKYRDKLIEIIESEQWIQDIKEEVEERRMAYRVEANSL